VPATRLDYAINTHRTAEKYDDFGSLRQFLPAPDGPSVYRAWWIAPAIPYPSGRALDLGLTPATDNLALKPTFITDLTGPHRLFQ
jgi:hypothetical protein